MPRSFSVDPETRDNARKLRVSEIHNDGKLPDDYVMYGDMSASDYYKGGEPNKRAQGGGAYDGWVSVSDIPETRTADSHVQNNDWR